MATSASQVMAAAAQDPAVGGAAVLMALASGMPAASSMPAKMRLKMSRRRQAAHGALLVRSTMPVLPPRPQTQQHQHQQLHSQLTTGRPLPPPPPPPPQPATAAAALRAVSAPAAPAHRRLLPGPIKTDMGAMRKAYRAQSRQPSAASPITPAWSGTPTLASATPTPTAAAASLSSKAAAATASTTSSGGRGGKSATKGRPLNKTSSYRGVSWHKRSQRWAVQLRFHGKRIHGGYYVREADAAVAYDKVARQLRGKEAVLNFGPDGRRLSVKRRGNVASPRAVRARYELMSPVQTCGGKPAADNNTSTSTSQHANATGFTLGPAALPATGTPQSKASESLQQRARAGPTLLDRDSAAQAPTATGNTPAAVAEPAVDTPFARSVFGAATHTATPSTAAGASPTGPSPHSTASRSSSGDCDTGKLHGSPPVLQRPPGLPGPPPRRAREASISSSLTGYSSASASSSGSSSGGSTTTVTSRSRSDNSSELGTVQQLRDATSGLCVGPAAALAPTKPATPAEATACAHYFNTVRVMAIRTARARSPHFGAAASPAVTTNASASSASSPMAVTGAGGTRVPSGGAAAGVQVRRGSWVASAAILRCRHAYTRRRGPAPALTSPPPQQPPS